MMNSPWCEIEVNTHIRKGREKEKKKRGTRRHRRKLDRAREKRGRKRERNRKEMSYRNHQANGSEKGKRGGEREKEEIQCCRVFFRIRPICPGGEGKKEGRKKARALSIRAMPSLKRGGGKKEREGGLAR